MFPYHDENQTRRTPYVTYAIIALNALVWLVVVGAGSGLSLARSVCELGLIPGELTGRLPPGTPFPMSEGLVCLTDPGRQIANVFTSMGLHGSWLHLLGNMWFLWIFGDNIEDSMDIVPLGILPVSIALPAWTMLVYWAAMQFFGGLFGLMGENRGGVAFWAHLGGFIAGAALVKLFARADDVRAHVSGHWEPQRVAARW